MSSTVYDFTPLSDVASFVLWITRLFGVCVPSNFAELSPSENVASVKEISIVSPESMLILRSISFSVIVPIGSTTRDLISLVFAHEPAMYFFHTSASAFDESSHRSPFFGSAGAVLAFVKVTASPSSSQGVNFIGVSVVAVTDISL